MVTSIIVLAVAQLFAQAVFFLHLGEFPSNRNRLLIALFVLCMVLCVALGSIWIMHNLSQNMMPHDISAYLHKEN
jgi:cytochrome o ubiquinol oxidase operon protein cyoD